MNIFNVHQRIIQDYRSYLESFMLMKDARVAETIRERLNDGALFPEPLIQFNPSFEYGKSLAELTKDNLLHPELNNIFSGYQLYRHQVEALKLGTAGKDFIVTSGTGSGKSLTYIGTIFDRVLKQRQAGTYRPGIKAIIVYPMNALINSQTEEFRKYAVNYLRKDAPAGMNLDELDKLSDREALETLEKATGKKFPISFAQYTGQEAGQVKNDIKDNPPDILMTNYMMLELIMTRVGEEALRTSFRQHLDFLVFDELHTYRGRQGADVAMLIRRIRAFTGRDIQCIGTSATMSSGGDDLAAQQDEVATVGQLIFGKQFTREQIISEYLRRVTDWRGVTPGHEEVAIVLDQGIEQDGDETQLRCHPLALWLEDQIGLEQIGSDWLRRRKPFAKSEAIQLLADHARRPFRLAEKAFENLLIWSERINVQLKQKGERRAYFPFRLHQFISQTGGVYVTLDHPDDREITLEAGHFIRNNRGEDQRLYQIVFSRASGHEFICVRKDPESGKLLARDFNDYLHDDEDDQKVAGYIIPQGEGEAPIWHEELIEELPSAWTRLYKRQNNRLGVIPKYRHRVPNPIYYNHQGQYADDPDRITNPHFGWFMPAKLLFDPTSGTFFDAKSSEASKLMRLGNEGRSTATTTLSLATTNALAEAGVIPQEQKLLSFTDNRQDAALQAGHFNDFVSIGRIRSAIWHALEDRTEGLTVHNVAQAVFDALQIPQSEYAIKPVESGGRRRDNEAALKDYLLIRILQDLRRGWRYTMPNLEQCALLNVRYRYLEEELTNESNWEELPLLQSMSIDERREFLIQTLDFIRTSNAIHHRFFFSEEAIVTNRIKDRLKGQWTLGPNERLETPNYMRVRSVGKPKGRAPHTASIGKLSNWGRYVGARSQVQGLGKMSKEEFEAFAVKLMTVLDRRGFVRSEQIFGEKGETNAYILEADAIEWYRGDLKTVRPDRVRSRTYSDDYTPRPNAYFQDFYRQDFTAKEHLIAHEHTGQVNHADRVEREELFRKGKMKALFCSPTMELGVDISNLNVVHLRNVPPNPANYAQRSGRAGRSGQGALVITYCSQLSAHDRHYFQHQSQMVAGAVFPPRINLENDELLKTHINASYLLEAGLDLGSAVPNIIDMHTEALPLREEFREPIDAGHNKRAERVLRLFRRILADDTSLSGALPEATLKTYINEARPAFSAAFDRWRTLYRKAIALMDDAHRIKTGALYHKGSEERKQADANYRSAERQLADLKNDTGTSSAFSEFYPFRYLAGEGYLPGYNFTRLPLRVAINGYESSQFLSRPRLLALREFGPRNIIYHNGQAYEVNRLNLTDIESQKVRAKVATASGYFLTGEEMNRETDPINPNVNLNAGGGELLTNLVEMVESETRILQRISCEEEERRRTGYEIETYFSLPNGLAGCDRIFVKSGDDDLLEIFYMPTATIIDVNKCERRTRQSQFLIDKVYGYWKKEKDQENDTEGRIVPVSLFSRMTTNAIYIQPTKKLGLDEAQVVTLKYALKRAIEERYQVESNEIGVQLMGQDEVANIMIFERSEGSLGILGQLARQPGEFHAVVKQALDICFPPDYDGDYNDLPPATYNDLLSYYNQRHHEIINRHEIRDVLKSLLENTHIELAGRNTVGDYDSHYQHLLATYDKSSSTELRFLEYLYQHGLRLPDTAQPRLSEDFGLYVMPDFQYDKHVFVFCDGTPHDTEAVAKDDRQKRRAMKAKGLRAIIYHYQDDLGLMVAENADIFIPVRKPTATD